MSTLETLPEREFSAGMAEVIKYGMIYSKDFYAYISSNKSKLKNLEKKSLKETIKKCCAIKADIVSKDEKELSIREILNFGHTIGHALEAASEFRCLHGECVAMGMLAAVHISISRGIFKKKDMDPFKELLAFFSLPLKARGLSAEKVYSRLLHDKKTRNNKIRFILADGIGKYERVSDVDEDMIKEAIASVLE